MVSYFVLGLSRLRLKPTMTSNFFCSGFFGQIKDEEKIRKISHFFITCNGFSSELKRDTKNLCPSQKLGRVLGYLFVENFKKNSASWFFLKKVLKKRKFFRVFHLSSLISQNRDQIQKPFFLKTNSKDVGFFVLIKFSSSSMRPSFFC